MRVRSKGIMRMIRRIKLVRNLLYLLLLCVTSAAAAQAQNWSGILSPSRATDWTKAGLPATLPDGETTPNPWTPPTRTQCGSTITTASFSGMSSSNYVTPTAINTALSSCGTGHYVYVAAGTYYFSGTITLGNQNGVSLRLADGAKFVFNATPGINYYNGSGSITNNDNFWVGAPSYAQGANVIYVSSVSQMTAGSTVLILKECNTYYSAATPDNCTGSISDNGGLLVCSIIASGPTNPCSDQGASEVTGPGAQVQLSLVTAINANGVGGCAAGSGNYCVTISPGLLMPNWSTSNTPIYNGINPSWGDGLEGGTFDFTGSSGGDNALWTYSYASWMTGTRWIGGQGGTADIHTEDRLNCLMRDNYLFQRWTFSQGAQEIIVVDEDTYDLYLNNIFQNGPITFSQAGAVGNVFAYNYARDGAASGGSSQYQFANNMYVTHHPGDSFILAEGNQNGQEQTDSIHGSHNLNTYFRNAYLGDPPYITTNQKDKDIDAQGVSRFSNAIGNVIGDPNNVAYQVDDRTSNPGNSSAIYELGNDNGGTTDPVTRLSFYRWGNYDTITAAVRWCGNSSDPGWSTTCSSTSEVPTSIANSGAAFNQTVPSSTTLPPSFFLPTTAHSNGGTGLNWWKVCTNWPTCSTFTTQPFPPIGPDVTGGSIYGDYRFAGGYAGHANNIPAYIAWSTLPIDTNYQHSTAITASSWSGGVETLTFSNAAFGGDAPIGEFQISSGNCAGTFMVTNVPSTTTLQYAVASNPGSCTSENLLWPDVRQFGSTVYQNDSSGSGSGSNPPAAPTSLSAIVQ